MRKLIFIILFILSLPAFAQDHIEAGMTGLEAETIINDNFAELFGIFTDTVGTDIEAGMTGLEVRTAINDNFDTLFDIVSMIVTVVDNDMTGLEVRTAINNNFDSLFSKVWYFSNSGNDSYSGHSQDSTKATWAEFLTLDIEPGDKILFKRNDTWRIINPSYQGNLAWIGTEENPIYIGAYSIGDRPRMLGSDTITTWVNHSGNIWKGYKASLNDYQSNSNPFFINNDGTIEWGVNQIQVSNITSDYDAFYSNDTVYVYSVGNPNIYYASIEIPQLGSGYAILELRSDSDSAEHYIIDGLEVAYGEKHGISNNYPGAPASGRELSGFTIKNCLIHHLGEKGGATGYGANISSMRDVQFEDNIVHNCGRRGFSYWMDNRSGADSAWNIIIEGNNFYDGWHTTGVDINNVDGISNGTYLDSIYMRNNNISEEKDKDISGYTITGIYITDEAISTIKNTWIYNNTIVNRCAGAISSNGAENVFIYNNSIYGGNDNRTDGYAIAFNQVDSMRMHNNIIQNSTLNQELVNLAVVSDSAVIDNNLYYSSSGYTDAWGIGGSFYSTWSAWKTPTGQDANSPTPADPLFYNPPTNLKVNSTSDAVGAGIAISGYTTDYDGVTVSDPPNIGAYETTED